MPGAPEALEVSLKGRRLNPSRVVPASARSSLLRCRSVRRGHCYSEFVRQIDTVYLRMYLAASHIALGNVKEAMESVQRAVELDRCVDRQSNEPRDGSLQNAGDLERYRAHLRKAGLPE